MCQDRLPKGREIWFTNMKQPFVLMVMIMWHIEKLAIKKMVTKKRTMKMWQLKNGNWKCGDQKLMIKNVVVEICGNWVHVVTELFSDWKCVATKFVMMIKILALEFLGQSKGVSIATWFTMTKMGSISIACKLALGNSKVPLTWVDPRLT